MSTANDPAALANPLGPFVRFAIVQGRRTGHRVSLTSGLRTREQQIELRRQHCGSSQFAIYEMAASACSPPTAKPGESNHETGTAADIDGDKAWVAALLRPYNVTRPVPGEDWHFEWRGSDAAGDLRKLGAAMDALGYSQAEQAEVFGPSIPAAALGGGALSGAVSITTKAGSFTLNLAKRIPGVGPLVDAGQAAVTATESFANIAARLIDPAFWRRVGVGALGIVLIWAGLIVLFRSLIPTEGITNAIAS